MQINFFGPDTAYHEARRRFVFKGNPPQQRSRAPIRAAVEGASWALSQGASRPMLQGVGRAALSRAGAGFA
jgi:hypothetical protein